MNERDYGNRQKKEETERHLPPAWCGSICRNSMNEICIEHCAIARDCSAFEPKPNLKLADMPRFPKTEGMKKEEKFTSVTIYLSKVVEHLQGVDDEHMQLDYRRNPGIAGFGNEVGALMRVADSFERSQNPPIDIRAAKLANNATDTDANTPSGSESSTAKENE
jgi:hypothetical protein